MRALDCLFELQYPSLQVLNSLQQFSFSKRRIRTGRKVIAKDRRWYCLSAQPFATFTPALCVSCFLPSAFCLLPSVFCPLLFFIFSMMALVDAPSMKGNEMALPPAASTSSRP